MENELKISAHSAASQFARKKVQENLWTSEKALRFTELIYNLTMTGQLPDDPYLLGLVEESGWRVVTSSGSQHVVGGFELSV